MQLMKRTVNDVCLQYFSIAFLSYKAIVLCVRAIENAVYSDWCQFMSHSSINSIISFSLTFDIIYVPMYFM